MNLKYVVAIAIGIASASQLKAQRVATIGVIRHHQASGFRSYNSGDDPAVSAKAADVSLRLISSTGFAVASAFLLGNVGAGMEGPCSCDDPGLEGAILGVLTGIVVGAPLGAAAPSFGSVCSFNERFGRSFVGSLAGTAVGILAFTTSHSSIGVFAIPAFAAGGSVVSLGPCLNSRGG